MQRRKSLHFWALKLPPRSCSKSDRRFLETGGRKGSGISTLTPRLALLASFSSPATFPLQAHLCSACPFRCTLPPWGKPQERLGENLPSPGEISGDGTTGSLGGMRGGPPPGSRSALSPSAASGAGGILHCAKCSNKTKQKEKKKFEEDSRAREQR